MTSSSIHSRVLCRFILVLCLVGGLLPAQAQAQIYPHKIGLQGLLLDANGDQLTGNYNLTFRIYDAANGGTALWEGTHANVLVSDGLYGVPLGLNPNELPRDLFIGLPRHLEVSVNGEVLGPRIELRAVPIAYAAKTLTDGALQAGSNVSITRQADGILRIDANGGGGGGGLSSVATDATLDGDGTSGNPLGLDDNAVQAGTNVTVTRTNNGAFVVSSTGGGGGLSTVASDATLVGNGTGANPMGLADGAVTGAKMADGALVAGTNVTITRQGNGAFQIGATGGGGGFSLPFAGSTSSSSAAFSVSNTGSGDGINISAGRVGIRVTQAGEHGLHIDQANNGVNIVAAAGAGMAVGSTGNFGVYIGSAGEDGVRVNSAGRNGVAIGMASQTGVSVFQANAHGMSITTANGNGVEVGSAGVDGIQIQSAGNDGVQVSSAGQHGVLIQNAASRGVQIDQASIGMVVGNTSSNGIQVNQAGVDGIQIQSAGRDGIRVSSAGGVAGQFVGDVNVSGTLSKGGGSFKIDHPLDPANKYLAHSFVESPDMMNVYNGNAVLDAAGEAVVT
ncbi:MAG TPA: hypothetical protein VKP65_13915, partial [Rhodothermales bacterium]|nr:hypothetical protein [Rhodothermales bacterium]